MAVGALVIRDGRQVIDRPLTSCTVEGHLDEVGGYVRVHRALRLVAVTGFVHIPVAGGALPVRVGVDDLLITDLAGEGDDGVPVVTVLAEPSR